MSALVLHSAVRVLPEPASAIALQPEIETPPSVKLMLPVGLKPVADTIKTAFKNELIDDVLFVISYQGQTPPFPATP